MLGTAHNQLLHLVIGGELVDFEHSTFKDLEKVETVGVSRIMHRLNPPTAFELFRPRFIADKLTVSNPLYAGRTKAARSASPFTVKSRALHWNTL